MIETKIKNDFYIFLFILASLLFAHSPVLWGDYLRQDDWNAAFWNIYKFSKIVRHPEFYNSAVEMFRPVSTVFILIGDYISHNIENASYIRLFNIFLLAIASYLTYLWQIRLSPKKKCFAISFALLAFSLPASQLHSSTVSYGNMVFSIICGQIAAFYSAKIFLENHDRATRKKYYIYGILFIFLGSLNYVLSSMFYFVFLLMFYLTSLKRDDLQKDHKNIKFIFKSTIFIFAVMVCYIIIAKISFFLLGIKARNSERSVSIDLDFIEKIKHVINMLKYSFNLFDIAGYFKFNHWYSFFTISFFLILSLFLLQKKRKLEHVPNQNKLLKFVSNTMFSPLIILGLLILAYSPALAPKAIFSSFRYMPATMPFVLYIFLWSVVQIFESSFATSLRKTKESCFRLITKEEAVFIAITFFGLALCNHNLFSYIVGPHLHEMNYIRSNIELKALDNIKNNGETTIYIIKNNGKSYAKNNFSSLEYGFSTNYSHNWLVSATTYLMRQYGYESIIGQPYEFLQWDDKAIHLKTSWGNIISGKSIDSVNIKDKTNLVVIDMNKLGTFR
ncbi:MAG: hypothetical protein RLN62_03870 [Rickettsiales bacterium]